MKKIFALLIAALLLVSLAVLPAAADNTLVSEGKEYVVTGCGTGYINAEGQYPASYNANLTDGQTFDAIDYGMTSHWFAFYYNTNADASMVNSPEGIGNVTIDLGEVVNNISEFKAHVATPDASGIVVPTRMSVYVSVDNSTFNKVGDFTDLEATTTPYWATLTTENSYSAQYVRFEVEIGGVFAFVDEFQAYTGGELPPAVFEESSEAPVESSEAPAESSAAPEESSEAPAESSEAPAESSAATEESSEAPAESSVAAPAETGSDLTWLWIVIAVVAAAAIVVIIIVASKKKN